MIRKVLHKHCTWVVFCIDLSFMYLLIKYWELFLSRRASYFFIYSSILRYFRHTWWLCAHGDVTFQIVLHRLNHHRLHQNFNGIMMHSKCASFWQRSVINMGCLEYEIFLDKDFKSAFYDNYHANWCNLFMKWDRLNTKLSYFHYPLSA